MYGRRFGADSDYIFKEVLIGSKFWKHHKPKNDDNLSQRPDIAVSEITCMWYGKMWPTNLNYSLKKYNAGASFSSVKKLDILHVN